MNETMDITTKVTGGVKYSMLFKEGRLQTIQVEGPSFERRFYTREPRMHELELTLTVFGEIASNICRLNPESVAELKETLRGDNEFYNVLQKTLVKFFDQYKELILL